MSRRGNPYDNARAERFMRTLKEEQVRGTEYRNLEHARKRIGEFLEQIYNRQRLHSALRYLTPEEFEQVSEGGCLLTTNYENRPKCHQLMTLSVSQLRGAGQSVLLFSAFLLGLFHPKTVL
jgi:putative transposase